MINRTLSLCGGKDRSSSGGTPTDSPLPPTRTAKGSFAEKLNQAFRMSSGDLGSHQHPPYSAGAISSGSVFTLPTPSQPSTPGPGSSHTDMTASANAIMTSEGAQLHSASGSLGTLRSAKSPTLTRKLRLGSISVRLPGGGHRMSVSQLPPLNIIPPNVQISETVTPPPASAPLTSASSSTVLPSLSNPALSSVRAAPPGPPHDLSALGVGGVAAAAEQKEEKTGLWQNDDWKILHRTLLGIFQKPAKELAQLPKLERLNEMVTRLQTKYPAPKLLKAYTVVVCKGMMVLREGIKDVVMGDLEFFKLLSDTWGIFYSAILPLIMSIFCIPHGTVYPKIRDTSLTAFRDHVVLYKPIRSRLEATLVKEEPKKEEDGNEGDAADTITEGVAVTSRAPPPFAGGRMGMGGGIPVTMLPPRITQMLLVLSTCNHRDDPHRDVQKLLGALVPYIATPPGNIFDLEPTESQAAGGEDGFDSTDADAMSLGLDNPASATSITAQSPADTPTKDRSRASSDSKAHRLSGGASARSGVGEKTNFGASDTQLAFEQQSGQKRRSRGHSGHMSQYAVTSPKDQSNGPSVSFEILPNVASGATNGDTRNGSGQGWSQALGPIGHSDPRTSSNPFQLSRETTQAAVRRALSISNEQMLGGALRKRSSTSPGSTTNNVVSRLSQHGSGSNSPLAAGEHSPARPAGMARQRSEGDIYTVQRTRERDSSEGTGAKKKQEEEGKFSKGWEDAMRVDREEREANNGGEFLKEKGDSPSITSVKLSSVAKAEGGQLDLTGGQIGDFSPTSPF